MLKVLLDDLNNMSDEELIKSYTDCGIKISKSEKGERGNVNLYEYEDGMITGTITTTKSIELAIDTEYSVYDDIGSAA